MNRMDCERCNRQWINCICESDEREDLKKAGDALKLTDDEKLMVKIFQTLGTDAQLSQLQEECAELIVAVNKWRRKGDIENLAEEIADVSFMLQQIIWRFNLQSEVNTIVKIKKLRTENRIGNQKRSVEAPYE